ncbi:MAG TPA: VCBS repeat-containing protein, partial [Gammaproteobacteria bacterium]|nr:VCBS repeat-containing protein [Gammaproteobacteria bacterium]
LNTGTTSSPQWTPAPTGSGWNITGLASAQRHSPALGDLDGDGRADLLLGDSTGAVVAYRNTGSGWTAANASWNIADPNGSINFAGPAIGDLNGDGAPDVLYGDATGVSFAYQNTGAYSTGAPGTYFSKVVDAGNHGGFTTLSYTSTVLANTTLTVDIRAGDTTSAGDSTWTGWLNGVADGGDISSLNNSGIHQYLQYRANLSTTDNTATPSLFSIEAGTQAPPPQQTVVSVVGGSGSGGGGLGVLDLLVMSALAGLGRRLRNRRPQ